MGLASLLVFFTDRRGTGHEDPRLTPLASLPDRNTAPQSVEPLPISTEKTRPALPPFDAIYDEYFDLVWRNLRRLGVPEANLDDAAQEVFLVVHRRLGQFEGRSSLKTWLFSIVTRVASDARRTLRRKSPHTRTKDSAIDADLVVDERANRPDETLERQESARLLHRLLDELDDEKRTVFVLVELEEMTVPEIADAIGENINTIYARLRASRREFDAAVAREKARQDRRSR